MGVNFPHFVPSYNGAASGRSFGGASILRKLGGARRRDGLEFRICESCHRAYGTGSRCPSCQGGLSLVEPSFFVGKTFGKYRLEGVLGSGGMGVVYRVVHTVLNRPAALKLLAPQMADEQFVKRFLREARLLAQLRHPNIVEVYDFDDSEWGTYYYVMEHLTGQTLRTLIAQQGPSPDLTAYSDLLPQIGAGLTCAHRRGLVHRDLKPDNVFVTWYDQNRAAKIIDFGIAKVLDARSETTGLTTGGAVMGTLNYLAPEQVVNGTIGPHTDQYALGLICAEMALGRAVRGGKTLGEICSVEIRRPLALEALEAGGVPKHVRDAILRATQPEPPDRFPDVPAFLKAMGFGLIESTADRPLSDAESPTLATPRSAISFEAPAPARQEPAPPVPAQASASSPRLKRLAFVLAGVAAAVLLVLGAGFFVARWKRAPAPQRPATAPSRPQAISGEPLRIGVPPDAWKIVCHIEDTIVLQGRACLYLLNEANPKDPVRISFEADQRFLGASSEGLLYLLKGGSLTTLDIRPDHLGKAPVVLAKNVPEGEAFGLSPSGLVLGVQNGLRVEVFQVRDGVLKRMFSATFPQKPLAIRVSEGHLLVYTQGELSTHSLADGKLLWKSPFDQGHVNDMVISEDLDLVCLAGWFDKVFLFDLKTGRQKADVPQMGQNFEVCIIPDCPTLAIGGDHGLALWRTVEGRVFEWKANQPKITSVALTERWLEALDDPSHSLLLFPYRGFPIERVAKICQKEIWSLAADPDGHALYAGGADSNLYVLPLPGGEVKTYPLHTQGITFLALGGKYLASCSDDKTIAIWQLPEMKVIWRSQAHKFLINTLFLTESPPGLWSSSSDGTVKRWSWPQLEERETINVSDLLGRRLSLAALGVSRDQKTILTGTHSSAFVRLDKGAEGGWRAEATVSPSRALYSCVEVPGAGAFLFAGQEPFGCYLHDFQARTFGPVCDLQTRPFWALDGPGGKGALVAGVGSLLAYSFDREKPGKLSYKMRAFVNTELGSADVAVWVPGKDLLSVGNQNGEVCFVRGSALVGEPTVSAVFESGGGR